MRGIRWESCVLVFTVLAGLVLPETAWAVPSFSRQTGVPCSSCHTVFPQLTQFGRDFKRNGYVLTESQKGHTDRLQQDHIPPLAVMLQASFSHVDDSLPGSQNDAVALPDQLSLFYAGRISNHLGAFVQLTYDGPGDHFGIDNTDVRWATRTGDWIFGLTLNNAPTVSDLWNSTPVWGYPYAASPFAPGPAGSTLFDAFAQQTMGLGAYAAWSSWVQLEVAGYRSFPVGATVPPDSSETDVISSVAPYWRVALFHDWAPHSVELGTFGMWAGLYPGGGEPLSGETDTYTDLGVDGQYQYISDPHTLTVHARWIREQRNLAASAALGRATRADGNLSTFQLDATYFYDRLVGGTLAFFDTTGSTDAGLYPAGPVDGSATGSPDSRGFIVEVDYVPWLNTKLLAQYVAYTKFNGGTTSYDGSGRAASGNDTLYVAAWLMF